MISLSQSVYPYHTLAFAINIVDTATSALHIVQALARMSVSTVHISVLLSVVCLVVFVGGWYLQSSLMELNTQMMEQYYHNQEKTEQIEELNKQIIKQNDQITQQQLQLQQLNIIINVLLNGKASII